MKGRKAAGLSVLVIIYIITILNIVHIFRSIDKDVDFASMENVLSSNIAFRESFINIYGLFEKVSGVNIIDDKENGYIIKQDNGHLLWVGVTKQIIQETVVRLDHMLKVREYLEQQGIDSLYVQTPSKNSADEMNLPYGVHDYLIEMQDSQISYLREHGMKILDLREEFAKKGYSLEEVFFKTDHHWKPLYAFYANEIIADYMRGLGFLTDEEALDIKNYEVNTYRNWFLGSIGKRVGIYYAGIDDIDLIYPKFDTLLSFGLGGGLKTKERVLL